MIQRNQNRLAGIAGQARSRTSDIISHFTNQNEMLMMLVDIVRRYGGWSLLKKTFRILQMEPAYWKLVDVVLCLLHEAKQIGVTVTQYELVKAVFIAERKHLNAYGRPITFDMYFAMVHGPVPIALFNLLKEDPDVLAKTGPVQWKRRLRTGSHDVFEYYEPARALDTSRVIAQSEIEVLKEALSLVKKLGVSEVRRHTHEDAAYVAAWLGDEGGKTAYPMSYALMMENPDDELALEIAGESMNGYRP